MKIPFTRFEIVRRQKAAVSAMSPADWGYTQGANGGWYPLIREPFTGAWQRNMELERTSLIGYATVWACATLIASDIGKLWIDLMRVDDAGIRTPITNSAYSPLLRKPNHYQTRVKFFEYWMLSKLLWGNTYVLKERNDRGSEGAGNVTELYILDPQRVRPLITPNGDVYYQLSQNLLAGIPELSGIVVPAEEIIHDLAVPLGHPLCGVSPIYASGIAASQGLSIQSHFSKLFQNGSQPSGVLTAPGFISNETAKRAQDHWEANYGGAQNVGKVAVLGDGLKYEPMTMNAVDAQVIDQLRWTDERICATFHVPGYMVGIGPAPPYTDIQSINLQYYSQALQNPVENIEVLLNEGLELNPGLEVQFDVEALSRMDVKTNMSTAKEGVSGGIFSPNEARARFDLRPVQGGDAPYLQNQMWPLRQLANRPLETPPGPAPSIPQPPNPPPKMTAAEVTRQLVKEIEARIAA